MTPWILALLACKGNTDTDTDVPTDTDDTDTDTDDTDDTDTDTDIPEPEGDPATVELLGTCPLASRWGGIRIDNGEEFGFIDGSVLAGIVPATVPEPVATGSGCSLDRKLNPFCDPPCGPSDTCDHDGTCIPYPAAQDLGIVEVAGTNPPVRITPFVPGYNYSNTAVANPPVEADALVQVRIPDSPWGPIDLHGVGVVPLVASTDPLLIDIPNDLQVTWTPPTGLGRSRIAFSVNIDQHGNSPVLLTCDWPDTGSGSVPGDLLDQLVNAGVSGFPSAIITRHTADRVDVGPDGCMDLDITSQRMMSVRVDGFTPCNGPGQCPPGQECNLLIEICE